MGRQIPFKEEMKSVINNIIKPLVIHNTIHPSIVDWNSTNVQQYSEHKVDNAYNRRICYVTTMLHLYYIAVETTPVQDDETSWLTKIMEYHSQNEHESSQY